MNNISKVLLAFLVIFAIISLFRNLNTGPPVLDSPVYLYIAQRMLEGEIPYKDLFDHKTPGIYFINLIGLLIHKNLGVVIVEVVFIITSVVLSFRILLNLFGLIPAFFGTLIWLITLIPMLGGGNFPEDYVLPLQFGAIYLFLLEERLKVKRNLVNLLVGILMGLTFLIKQNMIGVFLVYFLIKGTQLLIKKDIKELFRLFLFFSLGFFIPIIPVCLYLFLNDALYDAYRDIFVFNVFYTGKPFTNILNVVYHGVFQLMLFSGITIIALIGWLDLLIISIYKIKIKNIDRLKYFFWFSLILLPVEFLLSSTSGRFYFHYYFTWLPVLAIFSGYFIYLIIQIAKKERSFSILSTTKIAFLALVFITSWLIYQAGYTLINIRFDPKKYDLGEQKVAQYLTKKTNPGDYVLVWGARTDINYSSETKSPTKYFYQQPLYMIGFKTPQMYQEFLEEIKKNKPIYIVDEIFPDTVKKFAYKKISCNEQLNPSYFDDFTFSQLIKPLPEIIGIMNYICENYETETRIGNWRILRLKV
jgi:4-amino-4-deoxy-L-arabinose transferase-like glycosyltransferase